MASLGARVRAAREAANIRSAELAERVSLSASAMSLIESDKRNIKANELAAIARALGVSVLSLLDESEETVASAARAVTSTHVGNSRLIARLNQVQDLRLALAAASSPAMRSWEQLPDVRGLDALEGARVLADWALARVRPYEHGVGRFVGLAEELGVRFGIDVMVESFDDDLIGAALLSRSYPTILINATQRRQRSLFTLAHEFGHLLSGDTNGIQVDGKFSPTTPDERRANAFAAEFLFPRGEVASIVAESSNKVGTALALMMDRLDGSYISCVYRLHNLGYIRAAGRDALLDQGRAAFIDSLEEESLRTVLRSRSDAELRDRVVLPSQLLGTLRRAYGEGIVGAGPIAGLTGETLESTIQMLAAEKPRFDVPTDLDADPVAIDDDVFTVGFPG